MKLEQLFRSKVLGGNREGSGGSGVTIKNQDLTVTENGTYTHDAGYTGFGMVQVEVPQTVGGSGEGGSSYPVLLEDTTLTETGWNRLDALEGVDFMGDDVETLLIIFDGVPYACNRFINPFGEYCWGDSRFFWIDEDEEGNMIGDPTNAVDVPFVLYAYMDGLGDDFGFGGWNETIVWEIDIKPEVGEGKHTVRIEKVSKGTATVNNEAMYIDENGYYTPSEGYTGFSYVDVNVPTGGGGDQLAIDLIEANFETITELPDGLTKIGSTMFSGSKLALSKFPDSLTSIKSYAFQNCTGLTMTSLPDGIQVVDAYTFNGCSNLALTSLPSELTDINGNAFQNCSKLAFTIFPSKLTYIGNASFKGCDGLKTLTFTSTPTYINSYAFQNSTSIKTINVPWAEGVVSGAPWGATNATINYNYTGA